MAVPGSGTLNLSGFAGEKEQDDYAENDYDDVLSLKDLTIGGNGGGNHFAADITNTASVSRPNNTAPYSMSEWYSYDHDTVALAMGNQKPQVFAYYITPSPNNGQTLTTQSALGTVATIPASNQSFSGTSTKRGSFTSNNSSINTGSLNATVNAASTNSWSIPTSGTLHNGLTFGITYYTTMWAHSSGQNLTVLSGTTTWKITGGLVLAAPTASVSAQSITMNANITDNGLGTSPASGATSTIVDKGFVYSTTIAAPTVGASGVSGSSINPNASGFGDEGAYSISISSLSAGTYNIRAYARKTDINNGPVTAFTSYYYSSTIQRTVASALTQFSGSAGQMGIKFVCTQSIATNYWHDGSGTLPAVGDTVYTTSAGTTAQTNRFIRAGLGYYEFSNLNGVVTSIELC